MFKHYFVVAFRNLAKYRQQTLISTLGLTVGFISFALSAYWIRYELSFDAFHPNADRIYQVRKIDKSYESGFYINTPPPLAATLEKYFPDIQAASVGNRVYNFEPGKDAPDIQALEIDRRFFDLFDVEILEGGLDMDDDLGVLVTSRFAREYLQTDRPVGRELVYYLGKEAYKRFRVRGVVKEWPQNTNLKFDVLKPIDLDDRARWDVPSMTYIMLQPGLDGQALKGRMETLQLKEVLDNPSYTLVPLTEAYYTEPTYSGAGLKFNQVRLFAVLGLLVILCSLFNFLNLYVSRIRMRAKELSLRKVNGASNRQLFALLIVEFGVLLVIALAAGFVGIEWLLPAFKTFAVIESDRLSIYAELFLYVLLLILFSLSLAFGVIFYLRRQMFQESVRKVGSGTKRGLFGRLSLFLQMAVGLGFIFCTTVYLKQIRTLDKSDTGVVRDNIMQVQMGNEEQSYWGMMDPAEVGFMLDALRSESSVEAVMPLGQGAMLPRIMSETMLAKPDGGNDEKGIEYEVFTVHSDYLEFYGLQLLAGRDFVPDDQNNRSNVIVNETVARALGFGDPIGKLFFKESKPYYKPDGSVQSSPYRIPCTIIGVVKDFVYESPLMAVKPIVLSCSDSYFAYAVKARPGQYVQAKEAIERLTKQKFPGKQAKVINMDESYRKTYASEASLRTLLGLLSAVCVLVSLFGIYSMASLSAESRRKEIAVRKVNGASLGSILALFLKEYLLLLAIGALVAFPAGYLIMKPWTEKFILQTSMGPGLFLLLFLLAATVIGGTVVWRIWRTAHINPSAELKKE